MLFYEHYIYESNTTFVRTNQMIISVNFNVACRIESPYFLQMRETVRFLR